MDALLVSKLRRPAAPLKRVARTRLLQRLDEGLVPGSKLTLISAPAGFGKTACVCEWLDGLDLPVSWLSLDSADDDPRRFFIYLIAALSQSAPGLCGEIERVLRSGQLPPAEVISTTLINELLTMPHRFVLVLDDFHLVQDPFILEVTGKVVAALLQENVSQPLHLVLITREDPALPLARLRARGQLIEIRASDLRFDRAEAGRFLNGEMGLALSDGDVAALEDRTEGWIAGLQLAAAALSTRPVQTSENARQFIDGLSGSHRYIMGYLMEEVLNRQTEEMQQFLLQTSVLDRLSGELCNAVTGRSDSRQLLEKMLNANLFLIPLDDELQWYRYHHLFTDLLRDLLKDRSRTQAAELHRRASRWYAQSAERAVAGGSGGSVMNAADLAAQAIEHALAAEDYPAAVDLIERYVTGMVVLWHTRAVDQWLKAIPDLWRARRPKTNLAFAWLYLLRGDFHQAMPYLERLHEIFAGSDLEFDPALQAEWLALQATLLAGQGQPVESLALAQQALSLAPQQDVYVRSLIFMAMAGAYRALDDEPNAVEAYQMLIQHGRAAGSLVSEVLGIAGLGQMALYFGQYQLAFATAAQGLERIEQSGTLPPITMAIHGELGQIYYQWHQLEQAQHHFERSVQVSYLSGYSDAELYQGVIQARLHLIDGDLEGAAQQIHTMLSLMRASAPSVVGEEVVYQQVMIALAQDRLADAEAALAARGFSWHGQYIHPDLAADQPVTPQQGLLYAAVLRAALYRGRAQGEQEILRSGLALAGTLFESVFRRQYMPLALTTLLLRTQMHLALGDESAGLSDAEQAVELGQPEGLISIFLEEGPSIVPVLTALLNQQRPTPDQADYLRQILSAFASHNPARSNSEAMLGRQALDEPLTGREIEVLGLLAEGFKYRDIADRLVVSVNTVRTHVKSIYGKLGVNNATGAVEAARRIKIIL